MRWPYEWKWRKKRGVDRGYERNNERLITGSQRELAVASSVHYQLNLSRCDVPRRYSGLHSLFCIILLCLQMDGCYSHHHQMIPLFLSPVPTSLFSFLSLQPALLPPPPTHTHAHFVYLPPFWSSGKLLRNSSSPLLCLFPCLTRHPFCCSILPWSNPICALPLRPTPGERGWTG